MFFLINIIESAVIIYIFIEQNAFCCSVNIC